MLRHVRVQEHRAPRLGVCVGRGDGKEQGSTSESIRLGGRSGGGWAEARLEPFEEEAVGRLEHVQQVLEREGAVQVVGVAPAEDPLPRLGGDLWGES